MEAIAYDLLDPDVRARQADLARTHGITAFCYWHYWFGGGRRTLERPFAEVLESGKPDFPFCLGWANETWSGIWHGNPGRVLIEQRYPGIDDERAHFELLLDAFRDPRYVRVEGRPLFLVYHPHLLPDAREFAARWRAWSTDAGLRGLFLVGMSRPGWLPTTSGFDAVVMGQTIPPSEERARHQGFALDRTVSGATNRT